MSAILKFDFQKKKKKKITFFWSKLSKLHKKDPILHVTTTFSLKQGETRTNGVPIPHPLRELCNELLQYSDMSGIFLCNFSHVCH